MAHAHVLHVRVGTSGAVRGWVEGFVRVTPHRRQLDPSWVGDGSGVGVSPGVVAGAHVLFPLRSSRGSVMRRSLGVLVFGKPVERGRARDARSLRLGGPLAAMRDVAFAGGVPPVRGGFDESAVRRAALTPVAARRVARGFARDVRRGGTRLIGAGFPRWVGVGARSGSGSFPVHHHVFRSKAHRGVLAVRVAAVAGVGAARDFLPLPNRQQADAVSDHFRIPLRRRDALDAPVAACQISARAAAEAAVVARHLGQGGGLRVV